MDEFPAIGTGNFLSLTGNRTAPNSEFSRMSVYWREADIVAGWLSYGYLSCWHLQVGAVDRWAATT
jgi:hypothetical protein